MYWTALALHILSAIFWLGGILFLGIVGAPVLRKVEPPELRQRLFGMLGERFRTAGWTAIGILLVTGTYILYVRGLLASDVLGNSAFWRTGTGIALAVKLVTVTVMLVLSGAHDFVLGPRAGRLEAGSPEALRLRRQAALMARVNGLVALVLIGAAMRLAR
ncbi:MAG TPA: DUF4149 domain-containing protein [Gemmatimonadales bacterium]|nr:DUF4149 domain-containing protein [Gemmatimonadales bacterium]